MIRIGVLVSGRGSNLQALIDNCESGYVPGEIVVVISDKKDAYGLERAENHNIDCVFVEPKGKSRKDFDQDILGILDEHNVDLVALAGYMRIIGPEFVKKYAGKVMNVHPALLPSFPGLHGQKDALDYGVKISGCTVHFVDEKVDHGPIIIQAAVKVEEDDTVDTLTVRIIEQEHKIYSEAVKLFAEGKLKIKRRRVKVFK